MAKTIFLDGAFVSEEKAVISVKTHALQYGTGCFEGIRAYYNQKDGSLYIFRLADHFKRLFLSGKILCMDIPYTVEDLCEKTKKLVQENFTKEDLYIRPFLFKSDTIIGGFSLVKLKSSICIYTSPMGRYVNTQQGIKVAVSSWTRVSDNSIPPRAKITGAYVNTALAKSDALQAGYDEAIFLDRNGHVLEGSAENIFIIRNNIAITPPVSDDILEGITRNTVFTLLEKELHIPVIERSIARTELYQADEVFLVGTGAEVAPVKEIDGRKIGKGTIGDVTGKLKKMYFAITHGEQSSYMHFVTQVTVRS